MLHKMLHFFLLLFYMHTPVASSVCMCGCEFVGQGGGGAGVNLDPISSQSHSVGCVPIPTSGTSMTSSQ